MKKLKIGIIDLVAKGPASTLWSKIMHANLASIMPQAIASWCEQQGHEINMICYTGKEDLQKDLPENTDLIFISAFTQSALLAYSLSNYYRSKGVVTVLGGPHARCYPDDAVRYFDYVAGFTQKSTINDILRNPFPQRPSGIHLSAANHPSDLPGVEERWKYIEPTLRKSPFLKVVPMLASMGCPYTCPFCIDSTVPYQPLNFGMLKDDLRFLLTKFKKPLVAWHDPNFGIKFNETIDAIRSVAHRKSFRFIGESSLSILTEEHLKKMKQAGFVALLPGIESWYDMGNKSHTSRVTGKEKVNQVSEHIKMIFRYIPYVQTNFVLGLDSDIGNEPFELTKMFIRKTPAAFPGYSLITAFGEAAAQNLEYQKSGRVLPFPFYFLNNHLAMNLKPKNYSWPDFYDKVIDLTEYSFSAKSIYRRFMSNTGFTSKWMNFMRAISSEGFGRLKFYRQIRFNLTNDKNFRKYFEGETDQLPDFYKKIIRKSLGHWWRWLPQGALVHDQNAYFHKSASKLAV
ncbi:MAG: radical SAM protein [Sphingobacteriales bacterium]|nr:radical SAM protein [Sphingobacteriales bacterium]